MKKYIVVLLYVLLILTLAGGLSAVFFHLASKETSDKAVSTGNTETVKNTELSGDVAESVGCRSWREEYGRMPKSPFPCTPRVSMSFLRCRMQEN